MPLDKDNMFFGMAKTMTDEQRHYVDAIFDKKMVFVNARSGTGKTSLAIASANIIVQDDRYSQDELVYIFSPIEEDKMGFRKGGQEEKNEAYLVPLKDALVNIDENPMQAIKSDFMTKEQFDKAWVTAMPHVFARGINLINKVVVIDESQNFTRGDLKKILTRIHDNCKVIVIGHSGQCDLPDPRKSGFEPYIKHYEQKNYASSCELNVNFRGDIANHADELTW
jgi:phosphate starvation-inducible protein PhoH